MFTTKTVTPPANQKSARPHSHTYWIRFGMAGVATLALLLLLLSSFANTGRAAQVMAPTIAKSSVTSIVETNNTIGQAVAGEIVTVTVEFTVPSGETIYDASPRVLLQDGLYPLGSNPAWSAMHTGNTTALRVYEALAARNGALVIFPTEATVTGPATLTRVVRAVRTQRLYVGTGEIGNNVNLRVQAVLRYCESGSGCPSPVGLNNDSTDAQVNAIQPQVNTTYATAYLDAEGLGAGGGQVRLTYTAANASGRPTAHDVVYTATLGSGLTWSASSGGNGAGTGTVSSGPGGVTYVRWDVPVSLISPQTWQAVVTATLPSSYVIGREFTTVGTAAYETFDGAVDYEGKYSTAGATTTLRPGLSTLTKASNPTGGAVTMGDTVEYTVVFRQAANTALQAPEIVDTQPLGFHYVPESLVVQNANVTAVLTQQGVAEGTGTATRYYENLKWTMSDLPSSAQARIITATYTALNTGLDFGGLQVYYLAADMRTTKPSIVTAKTGAVLSWTPPAGSTYSASGRANAGALGVIQPFMADNFSTLRTDSGPREVGQFLNFTTKFRNNGYSATGITAIPAYELQVCDTLPAGLIYSQDNGCFDWNNTPCTFASMPPTMGATGEICWSIPNLPKADATATHTYEFRYAVQVTDGAYPGIHTNKALVKTYSSKQGAVTGERVYSEFPNGLATANCGASCYTILGLAASKTAQQASIAPGQRLTYTLAYTDTSVANNYTGLVIVDTYDSLLTFVSANPAPNSHNTSTRELTWNLGALAANGSGSVQLVMEVSPVISGRYMLTNSMMLDSDQTSPRTWIKNTPVDVAALHVSMSGPATTSAGSSVAYTVVYSNTGSWNNAPVTLTLDYGPYLIYGSAAPLTPVPGTNNVFVTTVPNDGNNKTLTINLTVKAPLPYTLEEITSNVTLASAGAPSQADSWTMTLQRPVFEFTKSGPPSAPYVGGTILYNFHVKNIGDLTATGLVITDTWDAATTFQSGVGWTSQGSYATYTIASLAPGQTATINSLSVQVLTQSDSYLNQAALLTHQTSVQETELRIWSPSIALSKTAYPDPAFPGRVLTYTLTYQNVGGFTASNAVITDTLPSDFSYQGHTVNGAGCAAPGWQFTVSGQVATWNCVTLAANATGQLQIWGIVAASAEGTVLENMAESDGAPPIPRRPMDAPLLTLVARPWLRVNKIGAPTHPVAPGDRITYTLSYENYGSYTAYDVVIKDQLPAQVTFVGCSDGCTTSAGTVSWIIGEVADGGSGTVELYVQVKAGTGGQTAVNANYTIENTTVWQKLLPTETEHGPAVNTTVLNPQLTVTKAAAPGVVMNVNDTIVYTLTYRNTGGGYLHNVVITDALDIHTAFLLPAAPGCAHTGDAAGGTVTCQLGNLANGESRQVVIRVRVLPGLAAGDTITNQAQGDTTETAPAASNTTTVWYQVAGAPQISVAPTSLNYLVKAGAAAFDVPVVVSNIGPVPLSWAVTEDPSVTWLSQTPTGGSLASGANTSVTITFNPGGLAPGNYNTTLIFTSGGGGNSISVPVTLQVRAPQIAVTPASFDYTVKVGAASFTAPLRITNTGEVPITWNLAEDPSAAWLAESAVTGALDPAAATSVTLSFNPTGLAEGVYVTTLRITGDVERSIAVRLNVITYRVYLPLTIRDYNP